MSKELFISLLNKEFYEEVKHDISDDFFEKEIRELYKVLIKAYEDGGESFTAHELKVLYDQFYPSATTAKKQLAYALIEEVANTDPVSLVVSRTAYKKALINKKADMAATLLMDTQNLDMDSIREAILEIESLMAGKEDTDFVDMEVGSLLKATESSVKFKFNLPALEALVPGVGPAVLALFAGRVNLGKTCFTLFSCFGPGGFADQGARIVYLMNEEGASKTALRAVSCFTGLTEEEIRKDPELARDLFAPIAKNVKFIDDANYTMSQVNKLCFKFKPDIVVLDVLDHMKVAGEFKGSAEHMRLNHVYRQAREIAKNHKCAVIGTCQTSAEAVDKLFVPMDVLANSKTDKPAACDLIIIMGANKPNDQGEYSEIRGLSVAKNKISGRHGGIVCMIKPQISRMVP